VQKLPAGYVSSSERYTYLVIENNLLVYDALLRSQTLRFEANTDIMDDRHIAIDVVSEYENPPCFGAAQFSAIVLFPSGRFGGGGAVGLGDSVCSVSHHIHGTG
jgi:hypothetical protein